MKKPQIIRPSKLTMTLPEDIRAKLDLYLYSDSEQRIPHAAYQKFFVERINEFFKPKPYEPTAAERKLIKLLLSSAVQELPQEWWVENFSDPQSAYLMVTDLLKVL